MKGKTKGCSNTGLGLAFQFICPPRKFSICSLITLLTCPCFHPSTHTHTHSFYLDQPLSHPSAPHLSISSLICHLLIHSYVHPIHVTTPQPIHSCQCPPLHSCICPSLHLPFMPLLFTLPIHWLTHLYLLLFIHQFTPIN